MPLSLFRIPIVRISLLAVFLTGLGMFGVIIFVPLFFQGVLGASATNSGSSLTPMMLGIVFGAILSGQALSRLGGHYRLQGLLALAIMGLGCLLLSRMSVDTSYGLAVLNIGVWGIGLGMTLPVYVVAIQNAVPYRVLGVATSTTQFVRSIGGTMGLAILGSFMTRRFSSDLVSGIPPDVREAMPAGQLSALANDPRALINPEIESQLQAGLNSSVLGGGDLFQQLLDALRQALSSSISEVFLICLATVAAAWIVTLFLKEIPLQSRGPVEETEGSKFSA